MNGFRNARLTIAALLIVEDTLREYTLVEAMRTIVRTRMGPDVQHPSIGCSIKWKAS